ncbi:DUF4149 domain-containing protein [Pseudaestuariivita sp.]|uniref:DUF4149 domain-containing protein n=1 Tax=Pseudaestuariivita sp. TaxID=2211669 RepID=UPI0040584C56
MQTLAHLLTATLFGGMIFFSFGYAPVLFKLLGLEKTRPLLRGTFPYYYLVVAALAFVCALAAFVVSRPAGLLLIVICATTVLAREWLMPRINAATDSGNEASFKRLHGASVMLQLVQIALCGWALVLIV